MNRPNQISFGIWAAAMFGFASLAGCQLFNSSGTQTAKTPSPPAEKSPILTTKQKADMQYEIGRNLERTGDAEHAAVAYHEALKLDPSRGDAALRLAMFCDRHGRFKDSAELYQKALAVASKEASPAIFCAMGHSLSLQRRWSESEAMFKQVIALSPGHSGAHNNLGLVLAHKGDVNGAMSEFRQAGLLPADAHSNLALVMSMEGRVDLARQHYALALQADPSATHARQGLQQLDRLLAKGDAARQAQLTTNDEPHFPALTPAAN